MLAQAQRDAVHFRVALPRHRDGPPHGLQRQQRLPSPQRDLHSIAATPSTCVRWSGAGLGCSSSRPAQLHSCIRAVSADGRVPTGEP